MWDCIEPYVTALFDEPNHSSLNWVVTLASPCVPWNDESHDGHAITRWAVAALAAPYTEEIGQRAVDALLQIASVDSLRPHIPAEAWALLKHQPSLPTDCRGRSKGTGPGIVRHLRGLGDAEVLKSYFLLVWSEWDSLPDSGLEEMEASIRACFGGEGTEHHRGELIKRLYDVLGQLEQGSEYLELDEGGIDKSFVEHTKEQYGKLRDVLLEVDREAMGCLDVT